MGCARIFDDKASGARTERPGLNRALEQLRDGDTLVVWRLDRLAVCVVEWRAAIADTVVETHDRIVGRISCEAKRLAVMAGQLTDTVRADPLEHVAKGRHPFRLYAPRMPRRRTSPAAPWPTR